MAKDEVGTAAEDEVGTAVERVLVADAAGRDFAAVFAALGPGGLLSWPPVLQELLGSLDDIWVRVDDDGAGGVGADDRTVVLKPSGRFLDALAAVRAIKSDQAMFFRHADTPPAEAA
jgi:hypothetical protein